MRQYSTHKRFVSDVDRFMNRGNNLDKMMTFVINYLSLRQVHSDEISNDEIMYAVKKVTFADMDIPELYENLMDELTNQQFIFRIRRVKYIKNTQDSIMIVSSPLIESMGNELMMESISVVNNRVALIDPSGSTPEDDGNNKPDEANEVPEEQVPEDDVSQDEYRAVLAIWDDPKKRLKWLLDNVSYLSPKYNYSHPAGYDVDKLAKAIGKDRKTILHYIRRYLVESSKHDSIEKVKIE